MACALPEVEWLEYSFQNFDHLVEQPIEIRDGWIYAPDRPGHGLVPVGNRAPHWVRPEILPRDKLGDAPDNPRVDGGPKTRSERWMKRKSRQQTGRECRAQT